MRKLLTVTCVVLALGFAGCDGESSDDRGACVSSGAVYGANECMENWTRATCDEFDASGVNGATWTFFEGQSCSSLGW